jgi:WD40 repeat protein
MPSVACTISLTGTKMQVRLTHNALVVAGSSPSLSVTAIRFANDDKSLLACASRDGTLSVFNLTSEPPSLVATLRGHHRAVNDFDWSVANELLVSVSSDGTARLWDPASGVCLREISEGGSGRALCCRFHPNNNNLVAIGNSKAQVKVFNVSTGKPVKGGASKLASSALCLAFDSAHSQLWVGDGKGSVYTFSLDSASGKLHRLKRWDMAHPYGMFHDLCTCVGWWSLLVTW